MKRTLLAALALGASFALAACSATGAKPVHKPAAASAAPAAVQQTSPPPPAQPAAEANWEQNSPGYQSWLDVGSDMYQIGQDLDAGNTLALMGTGGEGFQLAEAAAAALQNPSPVHPWEYKHAMANFGLMGAALDTGNINGADSFAKTALGDLHSWAAAAQPGATGTGGCGNWNLPESSNCSSAG
jgi:hypothetical protein